MKKTSLAFLLALSSLTAMAQLNMTLADSIDYTQNLSSLWGYIDPEDSTEYAAVGTATGVAIVDLTDPYNIQEIAFLAGSTNHKHSGDDQRNDPGFVVEVDTPVLKPIHEMTDRKIPQAYENNSCD